MNDGGVIHGMAPCVPVAEMQLLLSLLFYRSHRRLLAAVDATDGRVQQFIL